MATSLLPLEKPSASECLILNRQQLLLQYIDKDAQGIEVGPSHAPVAPKAEGYHVKIIDHMNREQLIRKYADHHVDLGKIEEVDFVSHGEPYATLVAGAGPFHWIIASHVIEHTPDLIAFLQDCQRVLSEDGVLSLAIPDKRFCFDHFRALSDLAKVIDAHIYGHKIHTAGTVADYYMNVVRLDKQIAWASTTTDGDFELVHGLADAQSGIEVVTKHNAYLDVHAWCFTPTSFRLLIRDLNELGYIAWKELSFCTTGAHEFFVTLSRKGTLIEGSRTDILKQIEREQKQSMGG